VFYLEAVGAAVGVVQLDLNRLSRGQPIEPLDRDPVVFLDLIEIGRVEIGRASCRERV
jgi:hypothetical protein